MSDHDSYSDSLGCYLVRDMTGEETRCNEKVLPPVIVVVLVWLFFDLLACGVETPLRFDAAAPVATWRQAVGLLENPNKVTLIGNSDLRRDLLHAQMRGLEKFPSLLQFLLPKKLSGRHASLALENVAQARRGERY